MNKFEFDITILSPVCDSPVRVNFFYNKTSCCEYWLMPWETGTPSQISFVLETLEKTPDVTLLDVEHSVEAGNIVIESCKINNTPQSLSNPFSLSDREFQYSLSDLLHIKEGDFSVVKLIDLPDKLELTNSYVCNNINYVAGSDVKKAVLKIDNNDFKIRVELFKTNVVSPVKSFLLSNINKKLELQDITEKQNHGSIEELHGKIYDSFSRSDNFDMVEYPPIDKSGEIIELNDKKKEISQIKDKLNIEADNTAIFKIKGLPKNIFKEQLFYNDGAYFITSNSFKNISLEELENITEQTEIIIEIYKKDTSKPIKTLEYRLNSTGKDKKKISNKKKNIGSKRQIKRKTA